MLVTQPDLIEQSDLTGGYGPDGLTDAEDPAVLFDVSNLLVDRNTGALQVRPGYRRIRTDSLAEETDGSAITGDHYIKQLFNFSSASVHYLICVVVKLAASANNVQLFRINLSGNSVARIDTPGVTWANPQAMHWFQSIDGILYGGSKGNFMYSWDPSGPTWDDDAATPNTKAWVDQTGGAVNTATEYGRDNAWTGKELVSYSGDIFIPNKDIKYEDWDTGDHYLKGDLVSRKGDGYFRSYKCTDDHVADSAKAPDTGADWQDYWKRVRIGSPQDADGDTRNVWSLVPDAAKTSIAAWFADRLFLRFDGQGDNSRLQFSAPVKPDKGEDIPNVTWNSRDWAPGNDFKGQGGGWIPFNDGKHGGVITALAPFGQYLIVFKRRAVWVLSGTDDTTWTVRRVARGVGCVGSTAHIEADGLVYFLSDDGLYATDGTQVEPVPGNEKVQRYLRDRMDGSLLQELTDGHESTLFRWNGFIGFSIPDVSDTTKFVTVFYDPETESFWPTTLPVLDWQGYRDDGVNKAAFCRAPSVSGTEENTLVYIFDKANAGDADDTGLDAYATTDIPWSLTTAWLAMGTLREQRRIRRIWGVVKGAMTYTLSQYKDWSTSALSATARVVSGSDTTYIEGITQADSHAVRLKLAGTKGPASVYGYAIDTQPRRRRYHS